MSELHKTMRPYQVRLLTDLCRNPGDALVEQPTGSGKTMQIVTFVGMELGRRFSHAIIAAPQEQIEHGFAHRDYELVQFPTTAGVATPAVQVPDQLIWGARQSQLGSVKRLLAYLKQPGPLDHALACTHAALNRFTPDNLPADLSRKALFIDEAHHASADGLGQIVSLWRERGGQLYFFTATPYRGDGRPVALEDMRLYRRSLAEHMDDGFAPRHLESEIVALGQPGDAITAAQFTGEDAPPQSYHDALVSDICERWLADGKPKAIIRVPPMRGGSGRLVTRLLQAFADPGARVLDAIGTHASDKQRFLTALKTEQQRNFADSQFDVMIGIQRVMEGTDWPLCSAVYCIGMPGSLNTVVQLLGRAMRPKDNGYPKLHRNRARMVFFVPCAGGEALADLSIDHSRHALLTCCFLADHQVGQEWIVLREVRRGIEQALGNPADNPAAADAENEVDQALDPEVRAEVQLAIAAAREQITSDKSEPTLGKVVELAEKTRPDLPTEAFQRIATEIMATQRGEIGEEVRQTVQEEVSKRLRIDPMVKKAMEEAFGVVLAEFREVTLADSPALDDLRRQIHNVTGSQIKEFAGRLRFVAPRPLTEDEVLAWADAHHVKTGDWPKVQSGIVLSEPNENWGNLNQLLQSGGRELPGGSSIAKLLEKYRGVRNVNHPPSLSESMILDWADACFERTNEWPNCVTGSIEDMPEETWRCIDLALRKGGRGLAGGSSLAKLLSEKRGVKHHLQASRLTIERILNWADAEYKRSGNWPTSKTGPVVDAPNETWAKIDNALVEGIRGLPKGSSLAKLLGKRRGVRNRKGLRALTHEQVLTWADKYHSRTGKWPNRNSGRIENTNGETWANVDAALHIGFRGLDGGSSLTQLLAQYRGVRNLSQLPKLSEEKILEWADQHFAMTGKWPRVKDGVIQGATAETWLGVENALRAGLRGLPGGCSLALLLSSQRGKRHLRNLPPLTTDQILSWADDHYTRTGDWPKANSGPVKNGPGESWGAINAALSIGYRGLPGGSSLAKLLADERAVRNNSNLPALQISDILKWADGHYERTGKWPTQSSGQVEDGLGEKWVNIHQALRKGLRGLPGGSSLSKLIDSHRKRNAER